MKMKTLILACFNTCLFMASGLAQDLKTSNILNREVLLTNIQFSIGDTIIPFSMLVEPTGEIGFEEGFDFSYDKTGMVYYHIGEKKNRGKIYKDTIISTSDKPIHLTSFFPPLNQDSTKFISCYDSGFFQWSPHYFYELTYSYILNGVSASNSGNRIWTPLLELLFLGTFMMKKSTIFIKLT